MSRASLFRLLIVFLILGGSAAVALTSTPKLGLDLKGGTQIVLETRDSPTVEADAEATERTLAVLRGRVDALGVAEPTLVRSGDNRIIVELPGVQDPREAAEVIGKTAQLSFHPVIRAVPGPNAKPTKPKNQILPSDSGDFIEIGPTAITGNEVAGSEPGNDPSQGTGWFVTIDFQGQGGEKWANLTGKAACNPVNSNPRRVAIVLDGEVISSPGVSQGVACNVGIRGGSTQITGDFTLEEAEQLAILIEGGALPVPVTIISQSTVGPTLGDEAIEASFEAGIIGLILTGLFIVLVYRVVGFLATIALASYALISYAVLVALGATLTLPGLAGFVLAIGLAIDANVLVFERAREEYEDEPQKGLSKALTVGYNKAWTAILDSNVTTLLAAGLLFLLAAGPVKGFGVTLSIGVLASMVSALVIARVLTEQGVRSKWINRRAKVSGIGDTGKVRKWLTAWNPNIMGRTRLWLGISAGALLVAIAGIAVNGLNLGVEFTGGRLMEYSTAQPITADQAREAVADAGFPTAVVQQSGEDIVVRTGQISNQEEVDIGNAIGAVSGGETKERDELIGPSLGDELRSKALIAFGIALIAQMLYLAVRFKWTFGAAAVGAMFHDVILVVGLFAWLGKPIDGIFLAAALTIVGLSVNDTVVVFDRVREQWRASHGGDFAKVANQASIDTLPRTVNTGLGAMFILAALAILGGDSLQDFAIALVVGLAVGTYSSIFTATPIAVLLQKRWPMSSAEKVRRMRTDRDPNDSGAVV